MASSVTRAEIKFHADHQLNWASLISPLRRGAYEVLSLDRLSIPGDAPKNFIRIKEYSPGKPGVRKRYWVGYIAKVGSKYYPLESITEHMLTRIGQLAGLEMAQSQLRIVAGQVRFLSKYFLGSTESLVHGIEIFKKCLDEEFVEEIAKARKEQEFYTFQTVVAAVKHAYPEHHLSILHGLVRMLAFDALIGNNDRHPANWGVITPVNKYLNPSFSPIFDTARALFWNCGERKVREMLNQEKAFDAYLRRSIPQIGWDGQTRINHFELIGNIYVEYPEYRESLLAFCEDMWVKCCGRVIDEEFVELMSQDRRTIIRRCVEARHAQFCESID